MHAFSLFFYIVLRVLSLLRTWERGIHTNQRKCQVAPSGAKWRQVVPSGAKWRQVAPSGEMTKISFLGSLEDRDGYNPLKQYKILGLQSDCHLAVTSPDMTTRDSRDLP